MGCIARLGCLVLLALLAAIGWLTRDRWMSRFNRSAADTTYAERFEPVTASGATSARRAVESLGKPSGPVFVNMSGAELAALAVEQVIAQLPGKADSVEAGVFGDQLTMRAVVPLSAIGGAAQLGPLAAMLGDRERLQLSGGLRVVRPGLGEYQVRELKLGSLSVPQGMIPKLVPRLTRGARPDGLAPTGIPLTIPRSIGDVRLSRGHVTLYKTAQ